MDSYIFLKCSDACRGDGVAEEVHGGGIKHTLGGVNLGAAIVKAGENVL